MDELREPTTRGEIESFLDSVADEQQIHRYLADYPDLVCWTFVTSGGHSRYVFSQFPLGSRYKVDLVVLWCYSGAWEVHYIELEPVDDPIVTRAGTPGKRLRGAMKQVDDWRDYARMNPRAVRDELARYARTRDLLGYFPGEPLANYSGNYLLDPETYLKESYHIVIGREKAVGPHAMRNVRRLGHDVTIATYDRFVRVVAEREAYRIRRGLR